MTEPLPSPAELLRGRHSGATTVRSDANGVVHKLLDLADRGNYLEAAAQAAELLQGASDDVRLVAVYLAGLFVERGVPALPELLEVVEKLGDEPSRPLASGLEWLFRAVVERVAFHTTQRDATWESWLRELDPAQVDALATRCDALAARFATGAAALQKLARWAREKLMPAVARAKKRAPPEPAPAALQPALDPEPERGPAWDAAEPEPADDESEDDEHDDALEQDDEHEHDDDDPRREHDERTVGLDEPRFERRRGERPMAPDEARFARRRGDRAMELDEHSLEHRPGERMSEFDEARRPERAVVLDSPALLELRDKLRAFEVVLARGELDKAAVIAHDVQSILGNFDPVFYLPALFGRYSELLHHAFPELEARWSDTTDPRWRILVQFYRTNLAGFVGE